MTPHSNVRSALAMLGSHTLVIFLAALLAVVVLLGIRRAVRAASRRRLPGEEAGTLLAAAIATGVSAQGMWVFMQDALHLTLVLRVLFFGFLETMTVTSAMRARTAQRATGSAGVDGIAMWVLTSLSAILSATEADNLGTVLIRLSAPLVAAWGWERSMALERRLRTGRRTRINWRITPERLLIRLGLADPDPQRTASDEAAQRSLIAVALAVDDARTLRDSNPTARKMRRAQQRLRSAMRQATSDSGLIPFEGRDRRDVLLDHIAVLRTTSALLDIDVPIPWPAADGRLVEDAQRPVLRIDAHRDAPHGDPGTDAGTHASSSTPETSDQEDGNVVVTSTAVQRSSVPRTTPAGRAGAVDDEGWATVAEQVCADDPARRRQPNDVEAILRLHHLEHRTYPQIARQVDGFSRHSVGRVIRQARKYHQSQFAIAGIGGRQ